MQKLYARLNGNYDAALQRMGTDEQIEHFAHRFLEDGTYRSVVQAFDALDWMAAQESVDVLRQLAFVLGYANLAKSADDVLQAIEEHAYEAAMARMLPMMEDYNDLRAKMLTHFKEQ